MMVHRIVMHHCGAVNTSTPVEIRVVTLVMIVMVLLKGLTFSVIIITMVAIAIKQYTYEAELYSEKRLALQKLFDSHTGCRYLA